MLYFLYKIKIQKDIKNLKKKGNCILFWIWINGHKLIQNSSNFGFGLTTLIEILVISND